MKKLLYLFFILMAVQCQSQPRDTSIDFLTFCNPLDLSYRFAPEPPSRREAADPTMIRFRDEFFLFASKSGGYWHSRDMAEWEFIETDQIPSEEYAPTVIALGDTLFFLASSNTLSTIYKSTDPLSGHWSVAVPKLEMPVWDPAFFLDEDHRLYLYWGCSDRNPLYGVEVDYKHQFAFLGKPRVLVHANPQEYGWEVPGDYNTLTHQRPWIEGAWMNKYKDRYYFQYAGPGTEYKSYADAVYVSEHPLGPFTLQPHNPFAYKPEGFAAGAGHGSTFEDAFGNHWHIGTLTISQKHNFERRLGIFPTFFDPQGTMYSTTRYGDYPLIIPQKKIRSFEEIFPGWMLLSYQKTVRVSSSVDSLPAGNMLDENIRTYWAAASGNAGEYAWLDLGASCAVYAVQINFAEHNTSVLGRQSALYHRYILEYSQDGEHWIPLVDKSKNLDDNTHDYTQLENSVQCRYLKITNVEVPGGHFALSGFRVFGKGRGEAPGEVEFLSAIRNPEDRRSVTLRWNPSEEATGYVLSFGADRSRMYQHYMVYEENTVTINSLNTHLPYIFSIEAFNENGITRAKKVVLTE